MILLIVDPQCTKPYKTLSEPWRMIKYGVPRRTSHCDQTGNTSKYTQFSNGWYTFKFDSERANIPTTPPALENRKDQKTCGTNVPSWSPTYLPSIGQPPQDITVHFSWLSYEIVVGNSVHGKVVACRDEDGQEMYLYYLPPVKDCDSAYCAVI